VDDFTGRAAELIWVSELLNAERAKATVTQTPGSHAVFVSRPAVLAAVISQAAQG
jgi:hypothetical protein